MKEGRKGEREKGREGRKEKGRRKESWFYCYIKLFIRRIFFIRIFMYLVIVNEYRIYVKFCVNFWSIKF